MTKERLLVVAAALLISLGGTDLRSACAAEETPAEHDQKKARKVVTALKNLGIHSDNLNQFIYEIDERMDDGYLRLAEEKFEDNGTLTLRYDVGKVRVDRIELHYAPVDSDFEYTAKTDSLMMNYNLEF